MPLSFRYCILPEHDLLFEEFADDISLDGLKKASEVVWSDPDYHPHLSGLVDLRKGVLKLKPSEVPELARFFLSSEKAGRGRAALLVSEPIATGLSMLFQRKMSDFQQIDVFFDERMACLSLGIPRETLHRFLNQPRMRIES